MTDQPTAVAAATDHMSLLRLAVEKGAGADELEKLANLAERIEANRAKAEFSAAMNACQKEMPIIVRDASNKGVDKSGNRNTYVKLESMQAVIRPIYTRHGFSVSWSQGEAREGMTRVVAKLYHVGGHSENYQGDYPIDGTGAQGRAVMNPLQGTVSSHTYAQRDMLRLMFNLTIADYDLDGQAPKDSGLILADQVAEFWAICGNLPGLKVDLLLKWLSEATKRPVATVEEMTQDQFLMAKDDLLRKIKQRREAKESGR